MSIRRTLVHALLCATLLPVAVRAAPLPDAIVGDWSTKEEKSVLRIERDGATFTAAIQRLKVPDGPSGTPKLDHMNPDSSLRTRPVKGLVILRDLRYDGDGIWSGGRIYDPESGNTYRCKVELEGPDRLRVRGFIGIALVGRTEIWRRAGKGAGISP